MGRERAAHGGPPQQRAAAEKDCADDEERGDSNGVPSAAGRSIHAHPASANNVAQSL
jgi:hypothetical protein